MKTFQLASFHALLVLFFLPLSVAHGMLTYPPSRALLASNVKNNNTNSGLVNGGLCPGLDYDYEYDCAWWAGSCKNSSFPVGSCPAHPRTLPDRMRTWTNNFPGDEVGTPDMMMASPWFAPGSTSIKYPCGSHGDQHGNYTNMLDLPAARNPTIWRRGEAAEVAIGVTANHGGGWSFRLCPQTANATEECFQSHALDFVGDTSWIQHGEDRVGRQAFAAERLSAGTVPAGSMWTKNPIPGCTRSGAAVPACYFANPPQCTTPNCSGMCRHGLCDEQCTDPAQEEYGASAGCDPSDFAGINGTQFSPPAQGISGGLPNTWPGIMSRDAGGVVGANYNVVDLVSVPKSLKPGAYFLSWRWDCEASDEIFAQCSDIVVV